MWENSGKCPTEIIFPSLVDNDVIKGGGYPENLVLESRVRRGKIHEKCQL